MQESMFDAYLIYPVSSHNIPQYNHKYAMLLQFWTLLNQLQWNVKIDIIQFFKFLNFQYAEILIGAANR